MQRFPWYCSVGILVLIPSVCNAFFNLSQEIALIINNWSLLFHYTFLSSFIIKVIPGNGKRQYLKILFFVFFFLVCYLLVEMDVSKFAHQILSISSFGLTTFCIIYYYQLFKNLPIINLRKEPSFWIVSGVFIAMSLHIPVSATIDYLQDKISAFDHVILYNIIAVTYIVMHMFFIKAFICSVRIREV
jgi:hypothetical protein